MTRDEWLCLPLVRRDAHWVPVPDANSAAFESTIDGQRCVVVLSAQRHSRDSRRTAELIERTETKLLALENRVRAGRLVDPAKIGRAAQRILSPSGIGGLFDLEIDTGHFHHRYNEAAIAYEELLAGQGLGTTPAEVEVVVGSTLG